jgi:hypothetical protein
VKVLSTLVHGVRKARQVCSFIAEGANEVQSRSVRRSAISLKSLNRRQRETHLLLQHCHEHLRKILRIEGFLTVA